MNGNPRLSPHCATPPQRVARVLIVEDDPGRMARFRSWCPDSLRPVHASDGGRALGILRRDTPAIWAGLCLDHDLDIDADNASTAAATGRRVALWLATHFPPSVRPPILIHSMNPRGAVSMQQLLEGVGFPVTRIQMASLDRSTFAEWCEFVVEQFEGFQG